MRRPTFALFVLCGALSLSPAANAQTKVVVANYGVDSSICGSTIDPCRSISQAIINAPVGAQIVVGPGRYGDLNGDGTFGGAGEEKGTRGSCFCVLNIDKRVTLISRDGALQTVIDANGSPSAVVKISASSAVLGTSQHGFTVRGSTDQGGVIVTAGNGVYVVGNIVRDNASGDGIVLVAGTGHQVFANTVTGNGNGIGVASSTSRISGNYVSDNFGGGIGVDGTRNLVENNVVTDNLNGIGATGVGHLIRRNSAIGNLIRGMVVDGVSQSLGETRDIQVINNNIYGNTDLYNASFGNCAFTKGGIPGVRVDARNNFWGSASGPGSEPADAACNLDTDGLLITTPFATAEVPIMAGAVPLE
jgi:copper-binding protein NosD